MNYLSLIPSRFMECDAPSMLTLIRGIKGILRACSQTKIGPPIIVTLPILVVDFLGRPLACDKPPSEAMGGIATPPETNSYVPVFVSFGPGDGASRPVAVRVCPIQTAILRIIPYPLTNGLRRRGGIDSGHGSDTHKDRPMKTKPMHMRRKAGSESIRRLPLARSRPSPCGR